MKWASQDVDMFLNAKEYVDTAVIPLLPVSFENDMKQAASMSEFITLLAAQIERQFKGRLLMLPGFTYLKKNMGDKHVSQLKEWGEELNAQGFKHIFYVTSDSEWKTKEAELQGDLIWLPTLPLEHMDENYKISILDDQVKQLLHLFVQKWQTNN